MYNPSISDIQLSSPDVADQSAAIEEFYLQVALAKPRVSTGPRPKGACHFCEEPFEPSVPDQDKRLFCDRDCADDWEKMLHAQKVNDRMI